MVRSHVQVGPGYPASGLASCRSGVGPGRPRSSSRSRSSASFINSGAIDIFFITNIPHKRLPDPASAAARYCRHVATPSLQPTRCTRGRCVPCGCCSRAQDSSTTLGRCAGCAARPTAAGSGGRAARRVEHARWLLSAGHRLSRALIISGISMAAEYLYPHVVAELRMMMCGSCAEVAKRAAGVSI